MTSEDLKTVLMAAITTFGGIATAFILGYLEVLRRKQNENAAKMDVAATKADNAAIAASETKLMVNGRMDEWKESMLKDLELRVKKAYADGLSEGHRTGVASAVQAIAADPKIPVDQKAAMEAVTKAVLAPPS